MTPKTLLTFASETDTLGDIGTMITLAETAGAHLSVAVIAIAPPPPAAVSYAIPMDAWVEEREIGLKNTDAKVREIDALLQQAGISGDVTAHYVEAGSVSELVGIRARYSDLAIAFRDGAEDTMLQRRILPGLIFQGGAPFICLPKGSTPTLTPDTVAIAWNGTLEAARALKGSLPVIAGAKRVVVVMVDPDRSSWKSGDEPGFDVGGYLARHGLKVEIARLPGGGQEAGTVVLEHAAAIGADLLVMGAYGHSRLREYVLGGTTLSVLDALRTPVLMAH